MEAEAPGNSNWKRFFSFLTPNMRFTVLVNSSITFSANDLAAYIGVDRQTIYRMRASGRLPRGFLIGKRIRRWSLPELINHSDELKAAFLPLTQSDTQAANDNEPD